MKTKKTKGRKTKEYPSVPQVLRWAPGSDLTPTGLVATAQAAGLRVAPHTFQHEGLPAGLTLPSLLDCALGPLALDGIVCDFPDLAVAARVNCAAGPAVPPYPKTAAARVPPARGVAQ